MLDQEPGLSLRKLAARLEMKPERLCQLLNLLKLSPDIRRAIAQLPPSTGRDRVTEFGLRRIAALSSRTAQQRAWRAFQLQLATAPTTSRILRVRPSSDSQRGGSLLK